ncbi:MAG: UDP-N-acetylmuramate dehydrogenase [Proteobacteria bacterium]|nr:UDP-N-acetylmuramate dehydrogenase [Pseudomonadota bacterium]
MDGEGLIKRLPQVRGPYRPNYALSKINWFQVGGPAEVLFRPEDAEDLAHFMKHKPADVPVTVLGVGSNIIVRDGGINGVVIRLGRGFTFMNRVNDEVHAGGAALDVNVALFAAQEGLAGLEFLSGIPGTVGGALAMNAGAYGKEVKDVLIRAEALDAAGNLFVIQADKMKFRYRGNDLPKDWIYTRAVFKGEKGKPEAIAARIKEINDAREATQPIRERTTGSTFANPPGKKAWQLIDEAGCRGLQIGGAQMSEKHCNFMINTGGATAADLEKLGEEVRRKVKEKSGIQLEWEVKRIGLNIE